jgi:hypothetical protein
VCHLFREHIPQPTWNLIIATWLSVAWLPLLIVLDKEGSIWVCAILPLLLGNAVRFIGLKVSWRDTEGDEAQQESTNYGLFHIEESPSLWRTLLPSVVTVLATQAGIVALLMNHAWIAGFMFSIALTLFSSRNHLKGILVQPCQDRKRVLRSSAIYSLLVLVLIGIALMPYLKNRAGRTELDALLGIKRTTPPSSLVAKGSKPSGEEYSGIVLLLPPKPHHDIVPPKPVSDSRITGVPRKPIVIPFDGAYWYFKRPDKRPERDARVQRGDPLKENIRSTDRLPLLMAAHQTLLRPIKMDCCKALRVELINADNRPGAITIEILLRETSTQSMSMLSLGSIVIPSSTARSVSLTRAPAHESLTFHFPPGSQGKSFDEITLLIKPAWERALAGSKVAISDFVLIP